MNAEQLARMQQFYEGLPEFADRGYRATTGSYFRDWRKDILNLISDLQAIDGLLARRLALDEKPDRLSKIQHALTTAGKAEPKALR